MMVNFKKIGVAAAVASALGAAGAAQAAIVGAPGDALLIPYVIAAETAKGVVTNTLIGVTVADPNRSNPTQFADRSVNPPTADTIGVGTVSPWNRKFNSTGAAYCNDNASIHWYFFDIDSQEVADGTVPVTCEDFVRLDWNFLVTGNGTSAAPGFPSAKNLPGYMVITDNKNGAGRDSGLILYGAAYQIRGNWATQAFVPAVPLIDRVDNTLGDEVIRSGSFLGQVNPVTAGILLPTTANSAPGSLNTSRFDLRYVADTAANSAFPTSTTFVLWFPDTGYGVNVRERTNVLVYNAEEGNVSATVSIPHELNLVQVDPLADPKKPAAPHTSVLRDGLVHTESDRAGVTAVGPAVNTGYVSFDVKDWYGSNTVVVDGNSITQSNAISSEGSRAGFAYSLINIGVSNNTQTELAHERGLLRR